MFGSCLKPLVYKVEDCSSIAMSERSVHVGGQSGREERAETDTQIFADMFGADDDEARDGGHHEATGALGKRPAGAGGTDQTAKKRRTRQPEVSPFPGNEPAPLKGGWIKMADPRCTKTPQTEIWTCEPKNEIETLACILVVERRDNAVRFLCRKCLYMFWGSKKRAKEHLRMQATVIRSCNQMSTAEEEEVFERDEMDGRKGGRPSLDLSSPSASPWLAAQHKNRDQADALPSAGRGFGAPANSVPSLFLAHAAVTSPFHSQHIAGMGGAPNAGNVNGPGPAAGRGRIKLTATLSRGTTSGACGTGHMQQPDLSMPMVIQPVQMPAQFQHLGLGPAGIMLSGAAHMAQGFTSIHSPTSVPLPTLLPHSSTAPVTPGIDGQTLQQQTPENMHISCQLQQAQINLDQITTLDKPSVTQEKRADSAYNLFLKEKVEELKESVPCHKARFSEAARLWRQHRSEAPDSKNESLTTQPLPASVPSATSPALDAAQSEEAGAAGARSHRDRDEEKKGRGIENSAATTQQIVINQQDVQPSARCMQQNITDQPNLEASERRQNIVASATASLAGAAVVPEPEASPFPGDQEAPAPVGWLKVRDPRYVEEERMIWVLEKKNDIEKLGCVLLIDRKKNATRYLCRKCNYMFWGSKIRMKEHLRAGTKEHLRANTVQLCTEKATDAEEEVFKRDDAMVASNTQKRAERVAAQKLTQQTAENLRLKAHISYQVQQSQTHPHQMKMNPQMQQQLREQMHQMQQAQHEAFVKMHQGNRAPSVHVSTTACALHALEKVHMPGQRMAGEKVAARKVTQQTAENLLLQAHICYELKKEQTNPHQMNVQQQQMQGNANHMHPRQQMPQQHQHQQQQQQTSQPQVACVCVCVCVNECERVCV